MSDVTNEIISELKNLTFEITKQTPSFYTLHLNILELTRRLNDLAAFMDRVKDAESKSKMILEITYSENLRLTEALEQMISFWQTSSHNLANVYAKECFDLLTLCNKVRAQAHDVNK